MLTRLDKAIVAALGAGAGVLTTVQVSGDPHGYGLVAAVAVGVVVGVITFIVPNKVAA